MYPSVMLSDGLAFFLILYGSVILGGAAALLRGR